MQAAYTQQAFFDLADSLSAKLALAEGLTLRLAAEASSFVRFNHGLVRQAGAVRQAYLTLQLIAGQRHASQTLSLTGVAAADRQLAGEAILELRRALVDMPEDPHLQLPDSIRNTTRVDRVQLPSAEQMVTDIVQAATGKDLVGIFAAGPTVHAFADQRGQRNWQETTSFNFDFSVYARGDKAVKRSLAGFEWDPQTLVETLRQADAELELLTRAPHSVKPGAYRAYLTPAALAELIGMLNWEGFSEKALRTQRSSLLRLARGEQQLSPLVNLSEHTAAGLAPGFQASGFIKPASVPLLEAGKLTGSLISPRTAREYGLESNGAEAEESALSFDMGPGELPTASALQALDTGLFISNLWYLGYSDRLACRVTGMTRFASFWVENGQIVAPLNVMRFDDSVYRLLGDQLLGLTRERELLIDPSSYGARSSASMHLPGALLAALNLVL